MVEATLSYDDIYYTSDKKVSKVRVTIELHHLDDFYISIQVVN